MDASEVMRRMRTQKKWTLRAGVMKVIVAVIDSGISIYIHSCFDVSRKLLALAK